MQIPFVGRVSFWKVIAAALFIVALFVAGVRYFVGLGASTNLSDAFPWGLWIGFDLLVGVGLAAGGFVIAATVHIFGLEKYKPIARPAILTAFLGYVLVIVALLFDLGLPWRIWHPLIYWNHHSVMFEVGWCVMLYTTVLAAEFSPMLFERLGWSVPLKAVKAVYIPLVIAGVLLSTMHQSSLGTLYVIAPDKLHALWYSPLLPVFFFISAVAAGLAMTIFESYLSHRAFGKSLEGDLLRGLARAAVVVLGVYAMFRLLEMVYNGSFALIFTFSEESTLFWGEFSLGVLLPMVLFSLKKVRHNKHGLFLAAVLTITGFIINRLNVAITGFKASSGVNYFPHWMELVVTLSIVAAGFVAFSLAVKYLQIFPDSHALRVEPVEIRRAKYGLAWSGNVLLGLWALLIVGAMFVGYAGTSANTEQPAEEPIGIEADSSDLSLPEDYLFPSSEDSPGQVTFSHETHVMMQETPSCATCHHTTWSLEQSAMPLNGELSYERVHEGDLCSSCHDGEQAFAVDDSCDACHQ